MRKFTFDKFGLKNLKLVHAEPEPLPPTGCVRVDLTALSLNYRDLLVLRGSYNPKLALPATPISDAAGVVSEVSAGVTRFKVGDPVVTHAVSRWIDGPCQADHKASMLGCPEPGMASEQVVLPADALLPLPEGYDFAQAATLPIAALTAWSALVTEGDVQPGQCVLTLGTGGVSIFALQLAKALGAKVIITSSSDEKLARAAQLGADHTINYTTNPKWDTEVRRLQSGLGVDLTVETIGSATFGQSLRATRTNGIIALVGALHGLACEVNLAHILMNRIHVAGIFVDSRAAFEDLIRFIEQHRIHPVIDRRFPFDELPRALEYLAAGRHFGKIVVEM